MLTTSPPGGKNFHVVHSSADVENAVLQTLRSAFEYQGAPGWPRSDAFSQHYRPKMFCPLEAICFFLGVERRRFQGQAPGTSCGDQGRQPHEVRQLYGTRHVSSFFGTRLVCFDLTVPSNKPAFDKILGYIGKAKAAGGQILIGGTGEYFFLWYV